MNIFKRKKVSKPIRLDDTELNKLNHYPHGVKGSIQLLGKQFNFHDAKCFYDSYKEIVEDEIYKFHPGSAHPLIIDCGANMGVSIFYFAKNYPQSRIIAFEPEEAIFDLLQKNVKEYFPEANIEIYKKAVWDSETTLQFFTDHGMGGSVENTFKKQTPVQVPTVRLANFLNQPIDLLKLDIEGAEYRVLKDGEPLLKNIQNIFVEYHSFINKEQKLEEILLILKNHGFRYHLKQSFSREKPFVDDLLACENMDMAINIFAYKPNEEQKKR